MRLLMVCKALTMESRLPPVNLAESPKDLSFSTLMPKSSAVFFNLNKLLDIVEIALNPAPLARTAERLLALEAS